MSAAISLPPSASTTTPDTDEQLDDNFDTICTDLPGPKVPVSPPPPTGAVSKEDTNAAADGRALLGFLPPLPALLREWSHPASATCESSACDKEKVQAGQQQTVIKSPTRKGAERTSSGTPIAVAVQSEHGGIDIDIAGEEEEMPPPPPPPRGHQQRQRQQAPFGSQSPLWSMLQSSVAAATTTATSGTAATTLDSPPVKVRALMPYNIYIYIYCFDI